MYQMHSINPVINGHLVDVVLRERHCVSVDGPILGVGEGLLLAEATQVHLATARRVVAGRTPDVAPLAVPERGLLEVIAKFRMGLQLSDFH